MVRHSKNYPEADTGPLLWAKLPASLKELHLAGHEKYFVNILREIQELLLHRIEALPRLQRIVMSWREDGDESESPQSWTETLDVSFEEGSIGENQRIVVRFWQGSWRIYSLVRMANMTMARLRIACQHKT